MRCVDTPHGRIAERSLDRTNGYDDAGHGYAELRRADPRIAGTINRALGDARTVINVGAGAGSYEPTWAHVLAIEPSATMRAQRPVHGPPALDAVAESLPLDDDSVDAGMAVLSVHHWSDPLAGLKELRRVARGRVVVLSFDIVVEAETWLGRDYLPELSDYSRARYLSPTGIADALGRARVVPVPVPGDCRDGFLEGLLTRPEAYLSRRTRSAQSAWRVLGPRVEGRAVAALRRDLISGAWDRRHGRWRALDSYDGGLRLIVSEV
jgi:SAM-dependent methyltransferase